MTDEQGTSNSGILAELNKPIARMKRRFVKWKYRNQPHLREFPGTGGHVLDACIAYNQHGAYCVPWHLRRRPAARKVFAGKVYEEATIALMIEHSAAGDSVHAGTFFGDFLPALSAGIAIDARVWAFEPNPESYRCADVTCSLNKLENVTLTHAGLGAELGMLALRLRDDSGRRLGGKSHLLAEAGPEKDGDTTEQVKVVTVDEAVPADRLVTVLQLDVEGFETPALLGALETIGRCRPLLILETLPEESWLDQHLFPLGYRLAQRVDRNFVLST